MGLYNPTVENKIQMAAQTKSSFMRFILDLFSFKNWRAKRRAASGKPVRGRLTGGSGKGKPPQIFGGAVLHAQTRTVVRHFKPENEDLARATQCKHTRYLDKNEEIQVSVLEELAPGILHCPLCGQVLYEVMEDRREVLNRVVTNAGRDAIIDAFTGDFTLSTFNYHDCGTGTNAEAVGDTALQTAFSGARVTGTQTQPTSDKYRSVATIPFTGTLTITEHGLFSQSGKPGGTLLDRTVFAAVGVGNGDSIQFIFELSVAAGG